MTLKLAAGGSRDACGRDRLRLCKELAALRCALSSILLREPLKAGKRTLGSALLLFTVLRMRAAHVVLEKPHKPLIPMDWPQSLLPAAQHYAIIPSVMNLRCTCISQGQTGIFCCFSESANNWQQQPALQNLPPASAPDWCPKQLCVVVML